MTLDTQSPNRRGRKGFTLVELLTVIAVVSILMTAGAIGLKNLSSGKSVGSAVTQAEAMFHFARQAAVANNTSSRVLIAKSLAGSGARHSDDLRRILVAIYDTETSQWELTDRGEFLPQDVFFSQEFSRTAEGTAIQSESNITGLSAAFSGEFFFYEFNSEGISTTPGAGFVVGSGVWAPNDTTQPRVGRRGERDFGGFVVWRNGRTSLYRSPAQIPSMPSTVTTF
ncbi:MAG: Tfp pilus assembly protein FimT/FimU [Luteolibacter sp.]|jgi:prepilin-type N-terminal cleavage/methylation domain-containing protein